jgi:hypothetical protein
LSPAVLIDLMKLACDQTARFYESLDPFAPAGFGVSWAGEKESLNWFDTARELTERWHHQQQIRLATNRPGIMTPELYYPVLDCFMRGLPFLYRNTITLEECPDESGHGRLESPRHSILVEVSGECGGKWVLAREADGWALSKDIAGEFAAQITIPQELAWRIFTKGVDRACALAHVAIDGDRDLGEKVLDLVAIIG